MKILPVAFDSLGVRSMATYVETADVKIFIDPGVSVSPDRYSLPPHKLELDRHHKMWKEIKQWVNSSDMIIVTHYHYDHHNPDEPEIYDKKDVFLKHPREFINDGQKNRAAYFLSRIEKYAKSIQIADNAAFNFGKTKIVFSPPVFHGSSQRLGYVIQVMIEDCGNERFIFSSDVQGPLNADATEFIIQNDPGKIIVDGPATYLVGTHYKKSDIDNCLENLSRIISRSSVNTVIIDHHLLRDMNWNDYISKLKDVRDNVVLCSAAGFRGGKEELLEAKRQEIYEGKLSNVDNYG
jgi:predicted metallo-beta-lactamase superfamily hydrolase